MLLTIVGCAGKETLTVAEEAINVAVLGDTVFKKDGIIVYSDGTPANGKIKTTQKMLKLHISSKPFMDEIVTLNDLSENLSSYRYINGYNAFYRNKNYVDSEGNKIDDSVATITKMPDRTDIFTVKNGIVNGSYKIFIGEMLYEDIPYVDGKREGVADRYLVAERQSLPSDSKNTLLVHYTNYFVKRTYANDILINERFLTFDKELAEEKIYKNGLLTQSIRYDDEKISKLIHYQNNVKHGEEISYNDKGVKIKVVTYINGKREGNVKSYHADNPTKLLLDQTFVNDELDGTERFYYESGAVATETTYRNGKQISPIIGYHEDQSKRFVIEAGKDLKNGYCLDRNGNRARDFTKEIEHRYSIMGLIRYACPEYMEQNSK
jgi:antitoxin component YwqK of YwqJK toxin-antitoxin module